MNYSGLNPAIFHFPSNIAATEETGFSNSANAPSSKINLHASSGVSAAKTTSSGVFFSYVEMN